MTAVELEPVGTNLIDELRATEYRRLDAYGHLYFDYTGAGLHAESQIREHLRLLNDDVLGNPHSASPSSAAATALVERGRAAVLRYFNADDDYTCIFTPNATGALRLVGESYPFAPGGQFLATFDNHNSVNGIRQFARAKAARTTYVPLDAADLRVSDGCLERHLRTASPTARNLFAYPAQSNFSGVKHPLAWIERAHDHGWDVLLDCAAFVPTSRLDLSSVKPDFVAISFYKMFGYPTGVGALIARREALARLERPWFSGGTVVVATVSGELAIPQSDHARFEDGTVNYLAIPAVEIGLRHLERIGIDRISDRVQQLGAWLLDELRSLRHSDGTRRCGSTGRRRGTAAAARSRSTSCTRTAGRSTSATSIASRPTTACRCAPGASATPAPARSPSPSRRSGWPPSGLGRCANLDDYLARIGMPTGGAIRASLGLASNTADIHGFLAFAADFRDLTSVPRDLPPRHAC